MIDCKYEVVHKEMGLEHSKVHASNLNNINVVEDTNEIPFEHRCGILRWRPDFLQRFRSIYLFLTTLCLVCIVQTGLSAGYMSSQITTLERRFSLDSFMIGVIQSFFEIGFIGSVIFVGFFGSRGRIPLWIGIGLIVMGLGAICFTIPEFITPFQKMSNTDSHNDLCYSSSNSSIIATDPPETNKAGWLVRMIFIFGQMLIGCGSSPVLSLGPTYIDDHVAPSLSPPLIAALYSASALGPVFGYGIGAVMLQFPVAKDIRSDSKPGDADWVGAWWGGYLCFAFSAFILASVLFFFPRKVREIKKFGFKGFMKWTTKSSSSTSQLSIDNTDKRDVTQNGTVNDTSKLSKELNLGDSEPSIPNTDTSAAEDYGKRIQDLPRAIWLLCKNKLYIVVCLAICFEMFLIIGFAAFLPKYIENEYKVTSVVSSLIAGGMIVPAGALGIFVGGIIMARYQLSRKRAILFSIVAVICVLVCMMLFFMMGCRNPLFAGINRQIPFNGTNISGIVNNCNRLRCKNCDRNQFAPVCDKKSYITYFSPCHAGCENSKAMLGHKVYYNCTCVTEEFNSTNFLNVGECPLECNNIFAFVVLLVVALFLTGITQNPLLMVTMRSVQKHERSFALGFQFVILRCLAYISSPIIYGLVIDAACVHWKYNRGVRGDCLVTDLEFLNRYLIGLSFSVKSIAAIIYLILYCVLPKHVSNRRGGGTGAIIKVTMDSTDNRQSRD